jgi:hypothetical protein
VNLTSSTNAPDGVSQGYAAVFGPRSHPNAFYAVTTADGNLTLIDTREKGSVVWSVNYWNCSQGSAAESACWGRQVQGDDHRVYVLQVYDLFALDLSSGTLLWTVTLPVGQQAPSLWLTSRFDAGVLLAGLGTVRAVSTANGSTLHVWSGLGQAAQYFGAGLRTDNNDSGLFGFIQTCPVGYCVRVIEGRNNSYRDIYTTSVSADLSFFYLNAVDPNAVFFIKTTKGGLQFACRHWYRDSVNDYCTYIVGPSDFIHGYGLASANAQGRGNQTRLYFNFADHTCSYHYIDGALVATSPKRTANIIHAHTVGMSAYAFLGIQYTGNTSGIALVGYDFESMETRFNIWLGSPGISPYSAQTNWENEVLYPLPSGFAMLFGAAQHGAKLDLTFADSFPSLVSSNIVVEKARVLLTSGSTVSAFEFSRGG